MLFTADMIQGVPHASNDVVSTRLRLILPRNNFQTKDRHSLACLLSAVCCLLSAVCCPLNPNRPTNIKQTSCLLSIVCCLLKPNQTKKQQQRNCLLKQNKNKQTHKKLMSAVCCCLSHLLVARIPSNASLVLLSQFFLLLAAPVYRLCLLFPIRYCPPCSVCCCLPSPNLANDVGTSRYEPPCPVDVRPERAVVAAVVTKTQTLENQ